jgi:hypothetical protein
MKSIGLPPLFVTGAFAQLTFSPSRCISFRPPGVPVPEAEQRHLKGALDRSGKRPETVALARQTRRRRFSSPKHGRAGR